MRPQCSIPDCARPAHARGLCGAHYQQWRNGQPFGPLRLPWWASATNRFWQRVQFTDSCWLWIGRVNPDGYGRFSLRARRYAMAHRWAYEFCVGPIPAGLTLDHLCRVRHCVNPGHLEPVTRSENVLRGIGTPAQNARKTHCLRGHLFDAANTYISRKGHRRCRTCDCISHRQTYAATVNRS